jgi:uncharacterized protein YuzE
MPNVEAPTLQLSVTARGDGSLEVAYLQLSEAKVSRTQELIESVLLIDLDSNDHLVGIEILAPIEIGEVIGLAEMLEESQREAFTQFVRAFTPPGLVTS